MNKETINNLAIFIAIVSGAIVIMEFLIKPVTKAILKRKDNKNLKQRAIDEFRPILKGTIENLEKLDCDPVVIGDMNKLSKMDIIRFTRTIEMLDGSKEEINEYLESVSKPKNILKRLKKTSKSSVKREKYFEQIYKITSITDAVVFLSYGLLVAYETDEDIEITTNNLEKEIDKVFILINEFKINNKEYIRRYNV